MWRRCCCCRCSCSDAFLIFNFCSHTDNLSYVRRARSVRCKGEICNWNRRIYVFQWQWNPGCIQRSRPHLRQDKKCERAQAIESVCLSAFRWQRVTLYTDIYQCQSRCDLIECKCSKTHTMDTIVSHPFHHFGDQLENSHGTPFEILFEKRGKFVKTCGSARVRAEGTGEGRKWFWRSFWTSVAAMYRCSVHLLPGIGPENCSTDRHESHLHMAPASQPASASTIDE